jgi:hypothetical protein
MEVAKAVEASCDRCLREGALTDMGITTHAQLEQKFLETVGKLPPPSEETQCEMLASLIEDVTEQDPAEFLGVELSPPAWTPEILLELLRLAALVKTSKPDRQKMRRSIKARISKSWKQDSGATVGVAELKGALSRRRRQAAQDVHDWRIIDCCPAAASIRHDVLHRAKPGHAAVPSRCHRRLPPMQGVTAIAELRAEYPDPYWLCKNHLRHIASHGLGLRNNIKNRLLQARVSSVLEVKTLDEYNNLRVENPSWFLGQHDPFRFASTGLPEPVFNPQKIVERFCGPHVWDDFQKHGHVTAKGFWGWLLNEPDIMEMIDHEFWMYRHHLKEEEGSGQARQGWTRSMYYSLVQQCLRLDPVYYAVSVALRPDLAWRLVCYPYITKHTDPAENTGFLHCDIGILRYLRDGTGGSVIQSALSLDDEDEDNCTMVVPGMHRRETLEKIVHHLGLDSEGKVTNILPKWIETKATDKFGPPIYLVCRRGDCKWQSPLLIHGSTPVATMLRRLIFGWPSKIILEGGIWKFEMPGTETLDQVAAHHRDHTCPASSTSGHPVKHGRWDDPFPIRVSLVTSFAIGRAFIGALPWDDGSVRHELEQLMGDSDDISWKYVTEARNQLKQAIRNAYKILRQDEMRMYGKDSYFTKFNN